MTHIPQPTYLPQPIGRVDEIAPDLLSLQRYLEAAFPDAHVPNANLYHGAAFHRALALNWHADGFATGAIALVTGITNSTEGTEFLTPFGIYRTPPGILYIYKPGTLHRAPASSMHLDAMGRAIVRAMVISNGEITPYKRSATFLREQKGYELWQPNIGSY